ncbi:MAG: YraN family protein [Spirochaetia bacterium]
MNEWQEGETAAAKYLEKTGCTVVRTNYRNRRGEIDIVAYEGNTLVFAEVKTWRGVPFEELGFSVDMRKRHTIVRESKRFLLEYPEYDEMFIRYDLIFIDPDTNTVEHIADAFTETGVA